MFARSGRSDLPTAWGVFLSFLLAFFLAVPLVAVVQSRHVSRRARPRLHEIQEGTATATDTADATGDATA
jgi:hypothetical protein